MMYSHKEQRPTFFPTYILVRLMGDRPRRSIRQPTRVPVIQTEQSTSDDPPRPAKRKLAEAIDPQTQLRNILESPKSILTTMDISVRSTPAVGMDRNAIVQ